MRLWSLHPEYLDRIGLVAVWREGLLAQKVLLGDTKGYMRHPQLERFRRTQDPTGSIAAYLHEIYMESLNRGYKFDLKKIKRKRTHSKINVTRGQIEFEFDHLKKKLKTRDRSKYREIMTIREPKTNPAFKVILGDIESWEKGNFKVRSTT